MARKFVLAVLPCKGKETRTEAIGYLVGISKVAFDKEPGTFKYAMATPREDDGKTLYVVEEYESEEAFDRHMIQPEVKAMVEWIGSGQALDGAPTLHLLQADEGFYFSKAEGTAHEDPFVVFAELDYKPEGVSTAIPYWKAAVRTGRDSEPGTLTYSLLKDPSHENKLFTFEVYESSDYLWNVHAKSDAIQQSIANTKPLRNFVKHQMLKLAGGFVYKP